MTDLLSRRFGADRCGGAAVRWLCPCQKLLIGSVPLSLPGRMGLKCPAYPPVPHRCLPPQPNPAARNTLRDGFGGRARAAATSSTAGVRSGSGRICHLRSDHLDPFAYAQAHPAARVACGASVDSRAAALVVPGDMRGCTEVSHVSDEVVGVIGLVEAD